MTTTEETTEAQKDAKAQADLEEVSRRLAELSAILMPYKLEVLIQVAAGPSDSSVEIPPSP